MLTVSNDFNEAMKSGNRRFETRVKIGDKVYTKKDINNWVYTGGSISGESFQIGSTFSNEIKIEFCSIIEEVKELTEVTVEVGVATYDAEYNYDNIAPAKLGEARVGSARIISYKPTVFEYVSLGTFYVTKCDPDRNENKTTLEASDRFVFLENEYVSELTYPASIRAVALEIANKSGSVINETNFSMISTSKINKPEGYTFRQAIGLIAQFEAGYARFSRTNQLEIMQLIDPKFAVSPAEYFQKGLTKNELMYQVGGISCAVTVKKPSGDEQVTYSSGSNTGPQIVLDNKIMTQDLLDDIYQKLKNLNFYPFTLNWRGNPALETGDWLTLTDRDGTIFKTLNLNYTLTFKGGLTATSSANTDSTAQTVSAYVPPLNQIIKEVNDRIDAAGKKTVYDGTETPPYPKEGDIWFKKNGPDDEIWIYSKKSDGTYDWILQTSTKLSDEIQEKIDNSVPSDEIVKTINLSKEMDGKEWLKITGAKIWLTDETRIDDAIIKDAMIGSLSASKINVGTLNGANVNITNLNASNISTGTLTGTNLSVNLSTGAVQFKKGYISGSDNLIRFDLDNSLFQSFDSGGSGFKVQYGRFTFYDDDKTEIGFVQPWAYQDYPGVYLHGSKNLNLEGDKVSIQLGTTSQGSNKIVLFGSTIMTNEVDIFGKLTVGGGLGVVGSKNALHITRDGVRATPAYETAESYLGDIGCNETDDNCQVIIEIETLFSDTVNTVDYEYQVFLQSYGEGRVYVDKRKPFYFVVKSTLPDTKFAWEIKAKRRGYEEDRLVMEGNLNNDFIEQGHEKGLF